MTAMLISLVLISYMAVMSRASGGGLFAPRVWSRLPEILFALPFGLVAAHETCLWYVGALAAVVAFFAMEMGHGTFYDMVGYRDHNRDPGQIKPRVQTIEKVVRPIYEGVFELDIYRPLYSWVCMGLKGLLIGVAAFPAGVALAILWPASYWFSRKIVQKNEAAEWLSGASAGVVLAIQLIF